MPKAVTALWWKWYKHFNPFGIILSRIPLRDSDHSNLTLFLSLY
jgi:hypothetical protein